MGTGVDRFSRLAALRPARGEARQATRPAELRAPDETDRVSRLLGAGVARNKYGEYVTVRNWFSTPEFTEPSPAVLELLSRTPGTATARKKQASLNLDGAASVRRTGKSACATGATTGQHAGAYLDPSKWLFLDTETTGLAGGTGTYAFLVGLAWWDAGGLQMEQFFLRDFSEEHSMLHELAERIAERPVLVTFNGKTFDWPLLENRFTMTRAIRTPKLDAHLDLLHPARALWRLRLGSVRLTDLERQVLQAERLGWRREDDVPSALIPQYYFDYLRGGSADPLAGVVRHNQMDLRGLAALFGKINSLLDERAAMEDTHSLDLFGLSRYLERRGERQRAHTVCAMALQAGLPAEFRPRATRELALSAKRRGDLAKAVTCWMELARDSADGVEACEQLAIHYDRREKDSSRALEYAELGMAKAQRLQREARDPYARARWQKRADKLAFRVHKLRTRAPKSAQPAANRLRLPA